MPKQEITLSDEQAAYIHQRLEAGAYPDTDAIVQAGLKLLREQEEEYQAKLDHFREEVLKGMDDLENGRYIDVSTQEELKAFFQDIENEGRSILREERAHAEANAAKRRRSA